ncbi:hypothetical protein CTAYLR_008019 [Chrysophaeum taylorii]|uniref:Rab-GAP TBC domain-containing protein n=1 Tax=Chrysophaeum taylorii TaxID=2483200 RepID=A0AAD7XJD0_9STRA|nr:hypothetical protein CTAYLR_008019 [Chrysophaeum taylorii]
MSPPPPPERRDVLSPLLVESVAWSLAFVRLEEVARIARCSRRLRSALAELGAGASSEVRRACRLRVVGAKARVRWWASVVRVEEARRAMLKRDRGYRNVGLFERCAGLDKARGGLERLSSRGTEGEIRRDVARTFATRKFFASAQGQDLLADVLVALATAHPQTGYCQGMNLVAGALLEVHARGGDVRPEPEEGNEEPEFEQQISPLAARTAQRAVFWLVSALCDARKPNDARSSSSKATDNSLELRELWRPGMPQLKLRVYQFDRLVARFLPRLRAHFREIGLAPDVLASQWFFTLFAYALPADWLPRTWDVIFADGWKAVMRLALARLSLAAEELLSCGLEDAGKYMRDRSRLARFTVEALVEASFGFKVTRTTLAELAEQFGLALLEERCCDPVADDGWLRRYGGQGDDLLADAPARALRSRLAELDETTKRDAAALRARVERVERDGAEARVRVEKATAALRDKRRLVGELVDAKRLAAADAARLVLALGGGGDRDDDDDDVLVVVPPQSNRMRHRGFLGSPKPKTAGFRPVPFSTSCLPSDDRVFVRDELRAAQQRAARAEKDLRVARDKLSSAARDFVVAQADLDEARERKRAVELQLVHVVTNATARRRGVLTEVVQGADTPDLNLVRRFTENFRRARGVSAPISAPKLPNAAARRTFSDRA